MNSNQKIILLVILFVSFILRISKWDYPMSDTFAWGDGTRDYLVASHIVKYGEFPLYGPYNLLDDFGIKNSPIYFYILALPLLIYDHPLTLGLVNIFLQIFVLVLIFLIAKKAFGNLTALMALTLLIFNPEIIKQSDYIWQPYLMMPIAYLSLYFFVTSYLEKNYRLLFLSLALATLAFAIHNSAFPWLVVLMLASITISIKQRKNLIHYLSLLISVFLPLAIFYIPVILTMDGIKEIPTQNIFGYLNNFNYNLESFLNTFYVDKVFLGVLLLPSILLYRNNRIVTFGIVLFFSPLFFASFFDKIRFHYLLLSSGIFAVVVANLLHNIGPKVFKLLLFVFLIWIFSGNLQFLKDIKKPFENQKFINHLTKEIASEIPNPKTFQVKSYAKDGDTFYYPVLDTIFLVPLEQRLNAKLAKLSDSSPFNHVQINEKNYIVLVCYKFKSSSSDCQRNFLKENLGYGVIKKLFSSEYISLYLSKQKAY